ncbi:MAG TPA: DUF4383 domain-containing protein, partial [Ardenticatenaceae bacterium]|nr:DUF4383 domain-containing protein [Ardenticatenaceae bacterium]
LRLDPLHSIIHLLLGLAGSYVGFWRPGASLRFTQLFGLFYLLLALLGTYSDLHFGMQLELEENALHWALGLIAALIGFGGPLFSTWARKE